MLEALNIPDKDRFTRLVLEESSVQECVIIQTCHRIEIFYFSSDQSHNENKTKEILKLWSLETGVSLDLISRAIQLFHGKESLRHLFYLTSGLESIVLGEDQILGQVRTFWLKSRTDKTSGMFLDRAFMKAINIGRKIRNETRINEGSLSISSAAVELAAQELGDLRSKKVLIVGAGEAGALAAETLKSKDVSAIKVANRTYDKSLILAQKISGEAIQFENVLSTIPYVDLVIAAVSVTQPVFREEQFASLAANFGASKRLLLIDISQPHAIEKGVGLIQGISLKTIEDLNETIAKNKRNREIEAEKSKVIISAELEHFELELSKLLAEPLITAICRKFEEIRKKEFMRAIRKIGESDEKKLIILERFSRELTERIAQIPIEQLRAAALSNNGDFLSFAEKIFQIKTEEIASQRSSTKNNLELQINRTM
jgi:glutamyl-tRNA reductase